MPEIELLTDAVRVALVVGGAASAVHYWLMCNFVTKAPHWVKLVALAPSVGGGVVMFFAGLLNSLYVGMVAAPFVVCSIVAVNLAAFQAGAHVSELLRQQAELREQRRQAYNSFQRELTIPVEELADIIKPSGIGEVVKMERRERERESA